MAHSLFRTIMTSCWDYSHCMQLSTNMARSFSILNTNHRLQMLTNVHKGIVVLHIQYLNENIHSASFCVKLKGILSGFCNAGCTFRFVMNAFVCNMPALVLLCEPPENWTDLAFDLSSWLSHSLMRGHSRHLHYFHVATITLNTYNHQASIQNPNFRMYYMCTCTWMEQFESCTLERTIKRIENIRAKEGVTLQPSVLSFLLQDSADLSWWRF